MLKNLKKVEVARLFDCLANNIPSYLIATGKAIENKKFNFAIHYNIENLKPFHTASMEAHKSQIRGFNDFDLKRKQLFNKYEYNPIKKTIKDGLKTEDLEKELLILNEEYKPEIEARSKELKDFEEMMQEMISVEICQVSFNDIPDFVDGIALQDLMPMVKESREEILKIIEG